MTTERNSNTVIRVYTSNCPPTDDMEYVKRSGRTQCERTGGEHEAGCGARTALPKPLRRRVRIMRDAERGHGAPTDGSEARQHEDAASGSAEQADSARIRSEAGKARSAGPGAATAGTAQGAAGDEHAAAQCGSSPGGTRRRNRRGAGMSRIWPGAARRRPGRRARAVSRPDYMKRMSRSTLVVCAVIMGVAAVRVLPFDWAQQAVAAMSGAVNMSVDLDKTLGELKFVREVIPDSAMVFWSGGAGEYSAPFSGSVTHAFSEDQPWLEYSGQNQEVRSVRSGRVVQLEQGDAGDWAVRIEHEGGMETVYAFLSETSVQEGDSVAAAQQIGRASGANGARIYFEMRVDGTPVDPSPYLGKL